MSHSVWCTCTLAYTFVISVYSSVARSKVLAQVQEKGKISFLVLLAFVFALTLSCVEPVSLS